MRFLIQFLILGLILIAFFEIGGAWSSSTLLLQPGTTECSLKNRISCSTPSDSELRYRNVTFNTEDRLKISGWYISGLNRYPGIIIVHGMGRSRHDGLYYANFLREQGYHLLLFDLRNHGKSEASFNSMGVHEKKDIHAAVKFLQKRRGITDIGIIGFGTGASTAILAMAENPSIMAGVFEGGYFEIDELVLQTLKNRKYKNALLPERLTIEMFKFRLNADSEIISPETAIPKISPRPVFIIHGTENPAVSFKHAKQLFLAANYPKQFWPILGGDQKTAIRINPIRAELELSNFFNEFL